MRQRPDPPPPSMPQATLTRLADLDPQASTANVEAVIGVNRHTGAPDVAVASADGRTIVAHLGPDTPASRLDGALLALLWSHRSALIADAQRTHVAETMAHAMAIAMQTLIAGNDVLPQPAGSDHDAIIAAFDAFLAPYVTIAVEGDQHNPASVAATTAAEATIAARAAQRRQATNASTN